MTSTANSAIWLSGYIPDLPTPFDESGRIDLKAFADLCERQIAAGVSALVVCEAAGEASTLSSDEHEAVIRAAVETSHGRARVIGGAGSNSTSRAIELTRRAEAAGADAVLSVVPYYNKPMQNGIAAHFLAVAGATGLPIILHDIPSRTVRELANDTLTRLAESRQFVGLRDGSGCQPPDVLEFAASAGVPAAVRRRCDRARLHRRWWGRLHLDCLQRDAGSLSRHLFQPQEGTADRALPAEATRAAGSLPLQGQSRRAEICAEPSRLDYPRDSSASGWIG
jgi:hypothetical protein